MPPFYKEQQFGYGGMFKKNPNQHELGYIKLRFFDSVSIFKPAVTVMLFDWQLMEPGDFEWIRCENEIIDQIKTFQEKCQVAAKDSKIFIVILLPINEEVSVEKCRKSLT